MKSIHPPVIRILPELWTETVHKRFDTPTANEAVLYSEVIFKEVLFQTWVKTLFLFDLT